MNCAYCEISKENPFSLIESDCFFSLLESVKYHYLELKIKYQRLSVENDSQKKKIEVLQMENDSLKNQVEILQLSEKISSDKYGASPVKTVKSPEKDIFQPTQPMFFDDDEEDNHVFASRKTNNPWGDDFFKESLREKENTPKRMKKKNKSPLSPRNIFDDFQKPKSAKKATEVKWLKARESPSESSNSFLFEEPVAKRSKLKSTGKMRQTKLNFTRAAVPPPAAAAAIHNLLDSNATFCEELLNATPENHDLEVQKRQLRRGNTPPTSGDNQQQFHFHFDSADDTIFIENSQDINERKRGQSPEKPRNSKKTSPKEAEGLREYNTPPGFWDMGFPETAKTQPETPTSRLPPRKVKKKL